MNRLFEVMPQHLNRIQVRTLTLTLQSLPFFCFFLSLSDRRPAAGPKLVRHSPSGVFWETEEFIVPFITASLPAKKKAPRPSHYHHHILLLA